MIEGTRPIPLELSQVRTLVADVMAVLEAAGLGQSDSYDVKTVLTEALTNAVKCRPADDPSSGQVSFKLDGDHLWIRVTDRGPGFDWEASPDPTAPERLLHEGGRGVYMINNLMDRVEYDQVSSTLTMEKHISRSG